MNKNHSQITTRFAPSPTGYLHLGAARTALFAFLFAKKNNGHFLLRIEDTDQKRLVKDADQSIFDALKWLGINWENDDIIYQSSRLPVYRKYADSLIESNHAYYCFCSAERLDKVRDDQSKNNQPTKYDGLCRSIPLVESKKRVEEKEPYVIRMKIEPGQRIEFDDIIRDKVSFNTDELDDQVLIKNDGFPTYHLASVVDDYEQGITQVIRGEEWLSSTPKHLLLYHYFGWSAPQFAHLPVIVNENKKKLSKRDGSLSVEDFRTQGYLSEAIINFIALLGWNPGDERETFSLSELEKEFALDRVQKSPAVFNIDKLNSINAQYIRNLDTGLAIQLVKPFSSLSLGDYPQDYLEKVFSVVKDRMVRLTDFDDLANYFFKDIRYNKDILKFKKSFWDNTTKGLSDSLKALEKANSSAWQSHPLLGDILARVVEAGGLSNGDVFWSVRVALSGKEASPSPSELLWVLGRDESLKRLNTAIGKVKEGK